MRRYMRYHNAIGVAVTMMISYKKGHAKISTMRINGKKIPSERFVTPSTGYKSAE